MAVKNKLFGKKEDKHNTFHIHYKKELDDLKKRLNYSETKIEGLEAKNQASEALRGLTEKHIDKLSEEIGEIKEMFKILSDEKRNLEIKLNKAVGIVESAKPIELMKKFTKLEGKFSMLEGKISLNSKKFDNFKNELSHFTQKLKLLKGEGELIKLQDRVREDLKTISKINNTANMHASKIENHFIKINEKVSSALKLSSELKELKKDLSIKSAILDDSASKIDGSISKIDSSRLDSIEEHLADVDSSFHEFMDVVIDKFKGLSKGKKKVGSKKKL